MLTAKNMATKEDTWINREDLFGAFDMVRESVPNDQLRAQINNYFMKVFRRKLARSTKRTRSFGQFASSLSFEDIFGRDLSAPTNELCGVEFNRDVYAIPIFEIAPEISD
jgi:hypothetical protein